MHVHLEPLGRQHLEFVRALRNSLRHWFFDSTPIARRAQEKWYREVYLKSSDLIWVIQCNGKNVGTISRKVSAPFNRVVFEIGNLMLLPAYQGKGVMLEAIRLVTAIYPIAFYIAHVKDTNAASLRLFKRAGFWRVPRAR